MAWHEWEITGHPEIWRDFGGFGGCPNDRFPMGWGLVSSNFGANVNPVVLGGTFTSVAQIQAAYRDIFYACYTDECPAGTVPVPNPFNPVLTDCVPGAVQPPAACPNIPGSIAVNGLGGCPTGYHNANDPITGKACCIPDKVVEPIPEPEPLPCDFCEPPPSTPTYKDCCDKTAEALAKIAEILKCLLDGTCGKVKTACDLTDECIDKITEKVIGKIKKGIKTCDGCCQAIKLGIISETECRALFAGCKCEECMETCTLAGGDPEGKCCKGCGKEPCCCKDLECVPCGPKEEPKQWTGWCNIDTGQVLVLRVAESAPGPRWQAVSFSDDERKALYDAQAACRQKPGEGQPIDIPGADIVSPKVPPFCNLINYASPGSLEQLVSLNIKETFNALEVSLRADIINKYSNQFGQLPLIGPMGAAIIGAAINPIVVAVEMAPIAAKLSGCESEATAAIATSLAAVGIASKYGGFDYTQFARPLVYAFNASCRNGQIDPGSAMSAYLADAIDEDELDLLWSIAGYCPKSQKPIIQAQRSKLVPPQLAIARRRGIISESDYTRGMRHLGFLGKYEQDVSFKLTEQVPALGDIIRYMVRDADDEALVARFDLDADFTKKFGKQLKKWADDQGIPEQVARYSWRAHWDIPSPGQLYQLLHRHRRSGIYGTEAQLIDDIRTALEQQDIAPFWIDKLMSISFLPLGRIDARRAFQIGAISADDVENAFVELGYDDRNAFILRNYNERLKNDAASNNRILKLWLKFAIDGNEANERMLKAGYDHDTIRQAMRDLSGDFARSYLAKAFTIGELSRDELSQLLSEHGLEDDSIAGILERLALSAKPVAILERYEIGVIDRNAASREMAQFGVAASRIDRMLTKFDSQLELRATADCVRAIKQRYLLGEIDAVQAGNQLIHRGITKERADKFTDWWECEKSAVGKTVPTQHLVGWMERGVLAPEEHVKRLTRIGYTEEDARQLTIDSLSVINRHAEARAVKQAKEQLQESKKAETLAKQAKLRFERLRAQAQRAQEQAKTTKQRREKQLLSAAVKVSKKCDCDVYDALRAVRFQRERVEREYGLPIDRALQVLLQAVEAWSGGTISDYELEVSAFASAAVDANLPSNGESVNGNSSASGATQPSG